MHLLRQAVGEITIKIKTKTCTSVKGHSHIVILEQRHLYEQCLQQCTLYNLYIFIVDMVKYKRYLQPSAFINRNKQLHFPTCIYDITLFQPYLIKINLFVSHNFTGILPKSVMLCLPVEVSLCDIIPRNWWYSLNKINHNNTNYIKIAHLFYDQYVVLINAWKGVSGYPFVVRSF